MSISKSASTLGVPQVPSPLRYLSCDAAVEAGTNPCVEPEKSLYVVLGGVVH